MITSSKVHHDRRKTIHGPQASTKPATSGSSQQRDHHIPSKGRTSVPLSKYSNLPVIEDNPFQSQSDSSRDLDHKSRLSSEKGPRRCELIWMTGDAPPSPIHSNLGPSHLEQLPPSKVRASLQPPPIRDKEFFGFSA